MTNAIALGVNVIEEAFEKLDTNIDNSDSEDEEDASYRVDPILEAKVCMAVLQIRMCNSDNLEIIFSSAVLEEEVEVLS